MERVVDFRNALGRLNNNAPTINQHKKHADRITINEVIRKEVNDSHITFKSQSSNTFRVIIVNSRGLLNMENIWRSSPIDGQ